MFSGPFRAPFPSPIASPGAVVEPWYLAGGVAAANCKAAYQPIGAASLAASYVNLANAGTNDAAPGVAPTHASATGWTFNGSTQYLTTGITPSSGWSAVIRFSGWPNTGTTIIFGGFDAAGYGMLLEKVGTTQWYYENQSFLSVLPVMTSGVVAIAGQQGYRNGVADGGAIPTHSVTWKPLYIGAGNNNGSVGFYAGAAVQAFALYDTVLTAAQALAIYTAAAALTG